MASEILDAILKKLEYFRDGRSEKHVRDIKGVLAIQRVAIDCPFLDDRAEKPEVADEPDRLLISTPNGDGSAF